MTLLLLVMPAPNGAETRGVHVASVTAPPSTYCHPGDAKAALQHIPHHMTAEHSILTTLQRLGPRSFLPALESIPRSLRTMYLHAWQACATSCTIRSRSLRALNILIALASTLSRFFLCLAAKMSTGQPCASNTMTSVD